VTGYVIAQIRNEPLVIDETCMVRRRTARGIARETVCENVSGLSKCLGPAQSKTVRLSSLPSLTVDGCDKTHGDPTVILLLVPFASILLTTESRRERDFGAGN
jgi:hypothetical protein